MHSPGLVGDPTLGFVHARQAPLPKEQEPQAQHTCLSVKGALHHFFWGVGGVSCSPCRPHPPASGSTLQYHLGLQSARARTQGCFHPGPVLSPTERPLQPSSSFFLSSSLGTHTVPLAAPYLRGVPEREHSGHSVVFQVLAVPKGTEALGSEVLGTDDCVLLGFEVGPADVEHPLLQQLWAAEWEPTGTAFHGTAL